MRNPNIVIPPPGPKTKAWIERYKSAIAMPTIWYNTMFAEGDGVYVKDLDGNDFIALTRTNTRNLGFRHPKIMAAARENMEAAFGVGIPPGSHRYLVHIAEKLKAIAPPSLATGRVSFCNTGSDATEFCMMLAHAYTGRQLILAHLGAHFGLTMGSLALSADNSVNRRPSIPYMPGGVFHIPYPNCYRCYFGQEYFNCDYQCLDSIQYTLDTISHPEETAAFFIEPIQSKEVVIPPEKYFSELQRICNENNILTVVDEVMVGFGRAGKMWGIDYFEDVEPDILYMSKSIANGISMAAILGRPEIMARDEQAAVVEGGAYTGNPVSCACALALIEVLQEENVIDNAAEVGNYIVTRFNELSERFNLIGDVRGRGLIIGIDLVKDKNTKKPAAEEAKLFVTEAFRRGVLIQATGTYHNVIRLLPPLILTKEEAETAITILEKALSEVERQMK